MKEKYIINGSNTTYKVWGVLVLIFGIIAVILGLAGLLFLLGDYNLDLGDSYITLAIFIYFCVLLIVVLIKIKTGILLVRNYISSKGELIFYAVLYFLSAFAWLIMIVFLGINICVDSYNFYVICNFLGSIIKLAWDIATGVLLISKQNKAISNISNPIVLPEIKTETDNL